MPTTATTFECFLREAGHDEPTQIPVHQVQQMVDAYCLDTGLKPSKAAIKGDEFLLQNLRENKTHRIICI